jgi:hypothetical protein
MLAYEVDLLLFNFLKEYFIYGGLIGGIFAVLDNKWWFYNFNDVSTF